MSEFIWRSLILINLRQAEEGGCGWPVAWSTHIQRWVGSGLVPSQIPDLPQGLGVQKSDVSILLSWNEKKVWITVKWIN